VDSDTLERKAVQFHYLCSNRLKKHEKNGLTFHLPEPRAARVVSIDAGGHRERVEAGRDRLIQDHLGLVRSIADRVRAQLPRSFEREELEGIGYLALVRAATRYRPAEHGGAPFSAYARMVIRGAMLDSARGSRWIEHTQVVSIETGRKNADSEPEPVEIPRDPTVEADTDRRRTLRRIHAVLDTMPPKMAAAVRHYYGADEPNMTVVGERLNTSRTTATQLRKAAVIELRRHMSAANLKRGLDEAA
jgi:RNA polymerase sigma factor (sigma-70 family)